MIFAENVPLAAHTTFRLGGPARYFVQAVSASEVAEALAFARARRLPHFILGGGSNLLVADRGFPGVVIKMASSGMVWERQEGDVLVTAAAGTSWDELVAETVARGAWGLENLSAIPGTVGAAPVQNIGAYGAEISHCLERVVAVDADTGREHALDSRACGFGYRQSVFKTPAARNLVILSVTFRLSPTPRPNLAYKDLRDFFGAHATPDQGAIRQAVIQIRAAKFPDLSLTGTAGSFWKNPIVPLEQISALEAKYPDLPSYPAGAGARKIPLAWILDHVCELKGWSRGAVGLFHRQPLVLVAEQGATADDVRTFSAEVAATVKARTGIVIEPEVQYLE
ncbi:MAG TPA: UDP-N-acetylmuramate dehydrogenase [Opitutaceae bacterium]|nr:UDP-N-acetylmuramate dehydrogenase [Opitutaceae bacterium]